MKKFIAVSALAGLFFMSANSVQAAATSVAVDAGDTLTLSDTDAGGGSNGELTFNPSPGVQMQVYTADATYVVMSLNTSAALGDQNEYGIHSGYSGYYQNATEAADTFSVTSVTPDATTGDIADPFAAWTAMGGAGGASGT